MALPETGILLLDESNLLLRQADASLGMSPFQGQPPLVTGAQLVLIEDLLDRDARDGDAVRLEQMFQPVASPGRVLQGQSQNLLDHLRRGGLGMALVDRGQVFESFETMRLEAPFVLVKLGTCHAPAATGLRNVAQDLRQFQHTQSLLG